MRLHIRALTAVLICGITQIGITKSAVAQDGASLFRELFPQPTGQNGYEEIIAAGDMLSRSTRLVEYEKKSADAVTLTEKRAILSDPIVRDALALFRQGIAKSLNTPRNVQPEVSFRAFAVYRRFARLLFVEQYVYCADGSMSRCIDSLHDGLRFGYAIQGDSVIGGMVGVAVDALVLKAIENRMDQLSERDCVRLTRMAHAWLEAPDPAVTALSAERDSIIGNMQGQFPKDASFPRDQVLAAMKLHIDQYISNLSKPYLERKPPAPLQGDKQVVDYVNALAQPLDATFVQTQNIFLKDQVRIQMLGVHAAIRSYRWEHNAYPPTLEVLKLGKMAIDPFTGKLLQYKTTGPNTYELTKVEAPQ